MLEVDLAPDTAGVEGRRFAEVSVCILMLLERRVRPGSDGGGRWFAGRRQLLPGAADGGGDGGRPRQNGFMARIVGRISSWNSSHQ